MKLLSRVGAGFTLNLLCFWSFAGAVDAANLVQLQSNNFHNKVQNNTFSQVLTPRKSNRPSQSTQSNTQFANFLPKNAPLVAMVDTSSATWRKVGNFQLFHSIWQGISFVLPPELKNGYAEDIEPWLGEQVAFAFLPRDGASGVTIESNFVTLAPVKDEAGLQGFLSKLKANGSFTERQYRGITILESKTDNSAKPDLPSQDNKIPPVPKSPINSPSNKAIKPNILKNS